MKIEIFWYDEWEEPFIKPLPVKNKQLVYSDTDTLENFIKVVCTGTDNLLEGITLMDYKEQWTMKFPSEIYKRLKQRTHNTF